VVWFSRATRSTPYAKIPTSPVEIDEHAAAHGYATDQPSLGAGVSAVVTFPEQRITIGITAATRGAVNEIMSTILVAPIDPLGCAAHLDAATKAPPGPSDRLVPADASSAVRCEYSTGSESGLLIGSYTLDRAKIAKLAAALNALVPDPCHCLHLGTPTPGHHDVLYFRYRDGSAVRVDGTIGENLDSYTNQTRTVVNFSSSVSQLVSQLTNQR
jgi:hypothetical protein